ncbi:MAG: deferrochelatase/peroxidase EfeB [Cryptosporangiaceae bacterium]|nr:deferrochelatase/peroxidase EfeB [Cryptosporangiaceae bacterium]
MTGTLNRRRLLQVGGAGFAVAAVGAGGAAVAHSVADEQGTDSALHGPVPFHGEHQAGITTPAQDRLHFAAFDVTTSSRDDLIALLKEWTAAAAQMTQGKEAGQTGATGGSTEAPPDDTGEALELPPSQLTITIGFGPSLFTTADGKDRFGIAAKRPAALADLPHFPADDLDPARSGGDIGIQACANDPQVAVHAIRNLARIAFGRAEIRWSQLGFGRTSSTSVAQSTPRNLLGFKDGTRNLKLEDTALLDSQLWAHSADGASWMAGGSYLVARRIRMSIEIWDRTSLGEQETIFGRAKKTGAPLTGEKERDEPDFSIAGADGQPLIAEDSHVRLAHPDHNAGAHLLRRGYNFVDGSDGLGRLDAGLFFLAYQRDPRSQFVPVQRNLAKHDRLNEYIKHVSSALFACPPGVQPGQYWGHTLFG